MSDQLQMIRAYLEEELESANKVNDYLTKKAQKAKLNDKVTAMKLMMTAANHSRQVILPVTRLFEASRLETGAIQQLIIELTKFGDTAYAKNIGAILDTLDNDPEPLKHKAAKQASYEAPPKS